MPKDQQKLSDEELVAFILDGDAPPQIRQAKAVCLELLLVRARKDARKDGYDEGQFDCKAEHLDQRGTFNADH